MATQFEHLQETVHHQTELPVTEPEEGNPKGTYFVVMALVALLALVAVYFWASHYYDFRNSAVTEKSYGKKDLTPGGVY